MARKVRISIAIDSDHLKRIDRITATTKQSRSAWISAAIADSIGQDEALVKFMTDPLLAGTFTKALSQPGIFDHLAKAIGAELTDEQLRLFSDGLGTVADLAKGAGVRPQEPTAKKKKRRK